MVVFDRLEAAAAAAEGEGHVVVAGVLTVGIVGVIAIVVVGVAALSAEVGVTTGVFFLTTFPTAQLFLILGDEVTR